MRRSAGRTMRMGSLNALRSSLRGFLESLERAGMVKRSPARVLRLALVGATPPLLVLGEAATIVDGRRDGGHFSFVIGTAGPLTKSEGGSSS